MESSRRITMQVYWKDEYESETWKIPVRWSGKRSLAFPAGSVAGNGPEGRVVDRKGVWWTGRASGGQEMSRRGIIGPESVAAASGQLGNSWNVKSAKRGLSACSVEGPLTTSCVSNMLFLKKNEKFLNKKNLIKMNHLIHIFPL